MDTWDKVYRGYVLRDLSNGDMFVGPNDGMWRVYLRHHAVRFSKEEALAIIELNRDYEFRIEDAT